MDVRSKQQEYYNRTAGFYEKMHGSETEHEFALSFLSSVLLYFSVSSLLDIGSGTGRVIRRLKHDPRHHNMIIRGLEPVEALREQAYMFGINKDELIAGDATRLEFENESFDFVSAFGVLHHVKNPDQIIKEMIRVASKGIFISDMNNFGCGSLLERSAKQLINMLGLWKSFQFCKTLGKGFKYSEGDGIYYSYSLYDNYRQLSELCSDIYILNTQGKGKTPYRSCSHVALAELRRRHEPNNELQPYCCNPEQWDDSTTMK